MQKAAKEKSSLLWFIALAMLTCVPSFASSVPVLPLENRVEIFLLDGQNGVGGQAFDAANHVENYDSLWEIALESSVAPRAGRLADASMGSGRVLGQFEVDLVNPPPSGWRYLVTPYKPKFTGHRIVDPASGRVLRAGDLDNPVAFHELQHFTDVTSHPELYYFARASRAPGSGLAHFAYETRGYLQSHGLRALFDPSLAMASVRHAGRANLVYRDLIGLGGLGTAGLVGWWFSE